MKLSRLGYKLWQLSFKLYKNKQILKKIDQNERMSKSIKLHRIQDNLKTIREVRKAFRDYFRQKQPIQLTIIGKNGIEFIRKPYITITHQIRGLF